MGLLLLMNLLLGRVIGPEGYGTFSFALALAGLLAVVAPLGWSTALVRFISQYIEQKSWGLLKGVLLRAHQMTAVCSMTFATMLVAVAYSNYFTEDMATSVMYAGIILPFLAFAQVRKRALQGLQHVKSSIFPDEVLLPLLVSVGLLATGLTTAKGGLKLYAFCSLVALVAGGILLVRSMPSGGREARTEFKTGEWLAVALPMVFGGISRMILNRTDVLMLGAFTDMNSVGLYTAASKLAVLNTFALTTVNVLAGSMLARAYFGSENNHLGPILLKVMLWSTVGATPFFAAMLLYPDTLMGFFGRGFEEGSGLLRTLAFGQFINAAAGPVGLLLLMTERERIFAMTTGVIAGGNIIGNLLAIPLFGAMGAAVVTMASVVVLNVWQLFVAWKVVKT